MAIVELFWHILTVIEVNQKNWRVFDQAYVTLWYSVTVRYWTWPIEIVDLPIKHDDFPSFFVCLPGRVNSPCSHQKCWIHLGGASGIFMGSQDVTSWASPGKSLENHVPNHQPVMDHNRILIMKNMGYMDHNNLISFFKQPFCSDYYDPLYPINCPIFSKISQSSFYGWVTSGRSHGSPQFKCLGWTNPCDFFGGIPPMLIQFLDEFPIFSHEKHEFVWEVRFKPLIPMD